jgi:hypothetical protein
MVKNNEIQQGLDDGGLTKVVPVLMVWFLYADFPKQNVTRNVSRSNNAAPTELVYFFFEFFYHNVAATQLLLPYPRYEIFIRNECWKQSIMVTNRGLLDFMWAEKKVIKQ